MLTHTKLFTYMEAKPLGDYFSCLATNGARTFLPITTHILMLRACLSSIMQTWARSYIYLPYRPMLGQPLDTRLNHQNEPSNGLGTID